MIFSIRRFLLVNLLLAITLTTSLTALGNYYLDQQDIQSHLDTLLSHTALSFREIITGDLRKKNFASIQKSLENIPNNILILYDQKTNKPTIHNYKNHYKFQVWDEKGNLLLHSKQGPFVPLYNGHTGFSDKIIDNYPWRVFTIYDAKSKFNFVIAEPYENRKHLASRITKDDLYIMLLTYPLSGLLIWIIIGKGLSGLNRIAGEISHRDPIYLDDVNTQAVPFEIKPLVDEINKLLLKLKQALDREKRFAADAAHELRTPLAGIKTQAQVALITRDPEEKENLIRNVISGSDRCSHIVQQLLALSRLVPEATVLDEYIEVNLSRLAAEVVAQLAPNAVKKKITIELYTPDQTCKINGNVTALNILMRNLIDNAISYTPENGRVQVSVLSEPEKITFKVRDNGAGIPVELHSRVFERFYRVVGNQAPGSGLGLAIVQQIATLHHAEIKLATPEDNIGLEISVTFSRMLNFM